MYQLYYYPNNASLAPHFLLHHMQLDYQLLLVDRKANFHKSPEYIKLNPSGRIPTLIYDGQALFESPAICIHLCESHPQHQLMPEIGDPLRPQFFQWLTYLNNTLQAELMVRYYPHRHTTDQQTVPDVVAAQDLRIAEALEVIDQQLAGKTYLLGEQLSACDYFLFMLALWSTPIERHPMSFNHLGRYLQRLTQLPSIIAVCEIEQIDISPFQIN